MHYTNKSSLINYNAKLPELLYDEEKKEIEVINLENPKNKCNFATL